MERINLLITPILQSNPRVRGWKPYRMSGDRDSSAVQLRTAEDAVAALTGLGIEVK